MQEWLRLQAERKLTGSAALWMRTHRPAEELYDTKADPYQIENLAENPAHQATLERMRHAVAAWMTRIGDQGLINEAEMIRRMWPGGVQPQTPQPYIVPRRSTGDPAQFLDRFAVCDKVDVGPRGRPVPKGGKVGHCSTQGNAQAAADTQPAEDFGRMRVGGDHDIRPMGLDQAQKPAPADPRQGGLRQATGGREDGENPKPDIPQPAETEENDSRGALADRDDCPPHRRQSIDRLDLDVRPFSAQLCRKGASRKVVTLPDARGHDHDSWRHRRSSLRR